MGADTFYLKTGVYQRMMDKCETEEEKNRIKEMYGHLVE